MLIKSVVGIGLIQEDKVLLIKVLKRKDYVVVVIEFD